jgi:rubrerythrin
MMNTEAVEELLLQSLEHELGGEKIYETALRCVCNAELKKAWETFLGDTREHAAKLRGICVAMQIDPETETPGRAVVRYIGQALERAMQMALAAGDLHLAERVAAECVVLAETKDHLDWEMLDQCGKYLNGSPGGKALREAAAQIEHQENDHLYRTRGFCRELWSQSLGMQMILPLAEQVREAAGTQDDRRTQQESDSKKR